MARKKLKLAMDAIEQAKIELEIVLQKVKETEELKIKADEEDKQLVESVENKIKTLTEDSGLFCGVILSTQDLLTVIQLAIESKENISIPFRLYFKD